MLCRRPPPAPRRAGGHRAAEEPIGLSAACPAVVPPEARPAHLWHHWQWIENLLLVNGFLRLSDFDVLRSDLSKVAQQSQE